MNITQLFRTLIRPREIVIMPKKGASSNSSSKAKTGASKTSEDNPDIPSPMNIAKNGDILISIQVKPGAKFTCVTDISPEAVSVQINAPPVDGEANTAIVKFFSELLKLKKTEVDLRGSKSRQKTVVISSKNVTPTSIMEILTSNVGEKY